MRPQFLKIPSLLMLVLLLAASGCKKDSSTGPASPITADLFPVVQGRVLVYTESESDAQNNPVAGTDHRVATMVGPTVSLSGRTGNLLIDSVYSTDGSFSYFDTLNVVSKGSDGTLYFTIAPTFFSILPITLPAVWYPMVQPTTGIGNQYQIYKLDTMITYQGFNVNFSFTLNGIINAQETVQVPAGSYSAYRGDVTYIAKVTSSGITLTNETGTAITMWLAEGIGPVKILYPAGSVSTTGSVQALIGKNF